MNMADTPMKGNQVQFVSSLAQAGLKAGATYYGQQVELASVHNTVMKRSYFGNSGVAD